MKYLSKKLFKKTFISFFLMSHYISAQGAIVDNSQEGTIWRVICNNGCKMQYSIKSEQGEIGNISIYLIKEKAVLEYIIPLSVYIPSGVSLVIDSKKLFETKLLTCDVRGCIGGAVLDQSQVISLKRGRDATIKFRSFHDNNTYEIPFTLVGFTKAWNSAFGN